MRCIAALVAVLLALLVSSCAAPSVAVVEPTPYPTYTPYPTPALIASPYPTPLPSPTTAPPAVIPSVVPGATPGVMPTPVPSTATPALPSVGFVADVTVPDGTMFEPGTPFTKTWRLKNTGALAWPDGVEFRWVDNEQMGASTSIPAAPIGPGDTADISVLMVAPGTPGAHHGDWRVCAGDVCFGTTVRVLIVVQAQVLSTATPAPPVVVPTLAPTLPPAPPPSPRTCCKICTTGKACGDSCISRSYTCHKPPGCACDG